MMQRNRNSLKFWLLFLHWAIILVPVDTLRNSTLPELLVQEEVIPTSAPIAFWNSFSSLSKTCEIWPHSFPICNSISEISAAHTMKEKWHVSSKKPAKTSDWLLFHSSMDRMKVMPRGGQKREHQVRTCAQTETQVQAETWAQAEAQAPSTLPSMEEMQRHRLGRLFGRDTSFQIWWSLLK